MGAFLRARIAPGVLLVATIAAGLAVRASPAVPAPVAKYAGVALWSLAVYACVLLCRPPLTVARASLIALALSFAVELAQLTPGPAYLSSKHVLLRLIFGADFGAWDLPAYAGGVLLGALLHRGLLRRRPV